MSFRHARVPLEHNWMHKPWVQPRGRKRREREEDYEDMTCNVKPRLMLTVTAVANGLNYLQGQSFPLPCIVGQDSQCHMNLPQSDILGYRELRVDPIDENTAAIMKLSRATLLYIDMHYLDIGQNESSHLHIGQTVTLKTLQGENLLQFTLRCTASP